MNVVAGLFYFLAALLLTGMAVWLFLRAGTRGREEGLMLRARALGSDEGSLPYVPRSRELRNPLLRLACHVLWRSGVDVEPVTVVRILWLLALLLPLALLLLGAFAGLAALGFTAMAAYVWLARRAAQRRARIVNQLPDFLEAVLRVLSAGNTLEEAFASAARETQEPIRGLFMSVGRQARLGAPLEQVLAETAQIHRLRDLQVVALAASINRKYGGSLRNVLKSLIGAVRARDVASRELRALTAETRFSALVLAIIPATLTLYILVQNPEYYAGMWREATGRSLLIASVLLQLGGIAVIWRMMRTTEEGAQ